MRMQKIKKENTLYFFALLYTTAVYGPMAAMSIGAGLLGASWLVLRWGSLKADLKLFRSSALFWPTVLVSVSCIWSLVWAKLSGLEFYGRSPTIAWIKDSAKIWHILFPFVLACVFSQLSAAKLRKVVKWWIFLGVLSAALGIVQHYIPIYHPLPLPDVGLRSLYHSTGMTGFHLSYASILCFPTAVSLAITAVLYRRERFSRRTRIAAIAAVLFFIANVFTYSKIAWASLPLTVLLISFLGFKGWPRYLIVASLIGFSLFWGMSPQVRLRFRGTDSIKERVEVWGANLEMIKQYPLFGVGWHHNSELSYGYYEANNMKGFASHAHNNFLDQLATTGLFGLIAFAWWCWTVVNLALQLYRKNHDLLWRSLGLGFVAGWFCLHLNGLTQTNFWDAKVLHQIGWVAAVTIEAYRRYNKRKKA